MTRILTFAAVVMPRSRSCTAQAGRITVFDGARILDGNGGAPIENGRLVIADGRITAIGPQSSVAAPQGATRVDRRRQDDHAGDDQRARAHGLRGLHHLERAQSHGGQSARSRPARSLLWRRGRDVGRQQSDGGVTAVPARSAGGQVSAGGSLSLHARHGAAQWRPRSHPARSDQRAACHQRGDDARRGADRDSEDGGSEHPPRQDVGRRSRRHVSETDAGGVHGDRAGGACAQDHRARARDSARRSKSGGGGRRRRARAHGAARAARPGISRRLLQQKKPYWATVISLGDPVEVCNADPFFEDAMPFAVVAKIRANQATGRTDGALRAAVTERGERAKERSRRTFR